MYINNLVGVIDVDTHYTKGKEYSLNGNDYIGEYHFRSGKAFAGPFGTNTPKPLSAYYPDSMNYTYDNLFNFAKLESALKQPTRLTAVVPTESDYKVGSYQRYFMQSLIDSAKIPVELTKTEFQTAGKPNGLDNRVNAAFSFVWVLTGPLRSYKDNNGYVVDGLYEKNEKTLLQIAQTYPNIIYTVKNYVEFARPSFV